MFWLVKALPSTIKYPPFHALEKRHEVDLGSGYMWPDSAKLFTHFIAESQRQVVLHSLSECKFSFLMDGSTDSGNLEVELVFAVFCKRDDSACEIRTYIRYLAVVKPTRADAEGLL